MMKSKETVGLKEAGLRTLYNRFWSYMHGYARRYRKAFYGIYTI
jgi:hypothetical protein